MEPGNGSPSPVQLREVILDVSLNWVLDLWLKSYPLLGERHGPAGIGTGLRFVEA